MKRAACERIHKDFHISERRACRLIGISRSTKRYNPRDNSEEEKITESMQAIASRWKRFGYRRINMMLQREGICINHKKVYRLYKKDGLTLASLSGKSMQNAEHRTEVIFWALMTAGQWTLSVILPPLAEGSAYSP